jgi:hypothetical protein
VDDEHVATFAIVIVASQIGASGRFFCQTS